MKRFLSHTLSFLEDICFIFTGCFLIFGLSGIISGAMYIEIIDIFYILAGACAVALLQTICYSEDILRRKSYFTRTLFFLPLCYLAVIGIWVSFAGSWPFFSLQVFLKFTVLFLALFGVLIGATAVRLSLKSRMYDDLMRKKQQEVQGA